MPLVVACVDCEVNCARQRECEAWCAWPCNTTSEFVTLCGRHARQQLALGTRAACVTRSVTR
eukprot:11373758-Alexandrium_andersonii.AAC.1